MKQTQRKFKKQAGLGLMTAAWISGLIIAGSDNLFMPWLNLLGLGIFTGASLLMGRMLQSGNQKAPQGVNLSGHRANKPDQLSWQGLENRNVGYALGVFIKT